MSGGSWNYLFSKEIEELLNREDDLEKMISRLIDEGAHEAAKRTYALLQSIRDYKWMFDKFHSELSPIWKAIEWRDSNDIGQETLDEILSDYEKNIS